MRLLKIVLSYSYELCLLDENRYQKLWEAISCEINSSVIVFNRLLLLMY